MGKGITKLIKIPFNLIGDQIDFCSNLKILSQNKFDIL